MLFHTVTYYCHLSLFQNFIPTALFYILILHLFSLHLISHSQFSLSCHSRLEELDTQEGLIIWLVRLIGIVKYFWDP